MRININLQNSLNISFDPGLPKMQPEQCLQKISYHISTLCALVQHGIRHESSSIISERNNKMKQFLLLKIYLSQHPHPAPDQRPILS